MHSILHPRIAKVVVVIACPLQLIALLAASQIPGLHGYEHMVIVIGAACWGVGVSYIAKLWRRL